MNGPTSHPAVQVLLALLGSASPETYLEIRPLGAYGAVLRRRFWPLDALQGKDFQLATPSDLEGKADVYFGVLPRSRRAGTAADVAEATCLWADLDRGLPEPWPEPVPRPSITVETSPGKYQLYWLLDQPITDLGLVEALNRRLAQVLGGDMAATDRARVLRLPGFPNLKYPERPLARLLELEPGRRYPVAQLEASLPPLPIETARTGAGGQDRRASQCGQPFDPHAGGGEVPKLALAEVDGELRRRGATTYHDRRLVGPCPFPGHVGQAAHNFYWSPVSGRWWCFGQHHPARQSGKACVSGNIWVLGAMLFPGRESPLGSESSASSPSTSHVPLGGEADDSRASPSAPRVRAPLEALCDAPRAKRTAKLLRSVGEGKKADAEANCGVPLKGKCPTHGVVREGWATGKTPWCAGCNTETSAKYLNTAFPEGAYTILHLQRHLEPHEYDAAALRPETWEMDPTDADRIAALIEEQFAAATGHFRRV